MGLIPTYIDRFHGVKIYEATWMGDLHSSAGITLPGYGIIIGTGVYSKRADIQLVMHEYGHILQCQQVGWLRFYLMIGIPSLISAWTNGYGKGHQQYWTEYWCNHLAQSYFVGMPWQFWWYPSRDISNSSKWWLGVRQG